MSAPGGWYPDHRDPSIERFWDGAAWSDQTRPIGGSAPPPPPPPPHQAPQPPVATIPRLPESARTRFLGTKRSKDLQAEVDSLHAVVEQIGLITHDQVLRSTEQLQREKMDLEAQIAVLKQDVVETDDIRMLQEVGVYEYRHPADDSETYKQQIDHAKSQYKALAKNGEAVRTGVTGWEVNGSAKEGEKMVRDLSKLLLRAYNNEADMLVKGMRAHRLDAALKRLETSKRTIERLGKIVQLSISQPYHQLRIRELQLSADYQVMREAEKEAERAEKARLREEAKALKELENEKARLMKEQAHYVSVLNALRESGTPEEIADAESKVRELGGALEQVEFRAANTRAGYVYVISNLGSFGEHMVKIGMTRRLEPMDRVKELGDASVPFKFDVHALFFSEDAVGLEQQLHAAFDDRRVNKVNRRREFFYIDPEQVRAKLNELQGSVLHFTTDAEAEEFRMSWSGTAPLPAGVSANTEPESPGPPPPPA